MMGMQVAAPQLFYDFCLDDYVPGIICFAASTGLLIWRASVQS